MSIIVLWYSILLILACTIKTILKVIHPLEFIPTQPQWHEPIRPRISANVSVSRNEKALATVNFPPRVNIISGPEVKRRTRRVSTKSSRRLDTDSQN